MSLNRGTIAIAGTEVQTGHWIGGERVESADTFSDFSPIDGTPLAEVAAGGRPEVDAAVAAARHAFPAWAALGQRRSGKWDRVAVRFLRWLRHSTETTNRSLSLAA